MPIPDYRSFQRSTELYHYGMPRRSGRYPWGSGERPYQSREEAKREKNLKIGRERLENRIKRANKLAEVDKLSRRIGWQNTQKAAKAHEGISSIKSISKEILSDDDRTAALGDYTRKVRIADVAVTSASIAAVSGLSASALLSSAGASAAALALPVIPGAAIGALGYSFYKKTKY